MSRRVHLARPTEVCLFKALPLPGHIPKEATSLLPTNPPQVDPTDHSRLQACAEPAAPGLRTYIWGKYAVKTACLEVCQLPAVCTLQHTHKHAHYSSLTQHMATCCHMNPCKVWAQPARVWQGREETDSCMQSKAACSCMQRSQGALNSKCNMPKSAKAPKWTQCNSKHACRDRACTHTCDSNC